MQIAERVIPKYNWQNAQRYLQLKRESAPTFQLDGITVIQCTELSLAYALFVENLPISWLYLKKQKGWVAWEVVHAFTYPQLQGHGLMTRIYRTAVNRDGIILASGKTQAVGSRALWARFIRTNTFNIWAQDFKNLDQRSLVWYEDDEIHCNLELYTKSPVLQDVRLIAVRKRPNGVRTTA